MHTVTQKDAHTYSLTYTHTHTKTDIQIKTITHTHTHTQTVGCSAHSPPTKGPSHTGQTKIYTQTHICTQSHRKTHTRTHILNEHRSKYEHTRTHAHTNTHTHRGLLLTLASHRGSFSRGAILLLPILGDVVLAILPTGMFSGVMHAVLPVLGCDAGGLIYIWMCSFQHLRRLLSFAYFHLLSAVLYWISAFVFQLSAVYSLLSAVRCPMSAVCCLLSAASCLLSGPRYMLHKNASMPNTREQKK
jgi:hypothetical protein